ncbi:unnamed protein product [Moneuplotes crassus]|uniref:Uncharacterized protein n=1 Tax=Euplotes crassus TaxID=5936 RepID=A0AAD2CX09_EUPCR|nr:unnamed protein product [Moneuplotes crassus]
MTQNASEMNKFIQSRIDRDVRQLKQKFRNTADRIKGLRVKRNITGIRQILSEEAREIKNLSEISTIQTKKSSHKKLSRPKTIESVYLRTSWMFKVPHKNHLRSNGARSPNENKIRMNFKSLKPKKRITGINTYQKVTQEPIKLLQSFKLTGKKKKIKKCFKKPTIDGLAFSLTQENYSGLHTSKMPLNLSIFKNAVNKTGSYEFDQSSHKPKIDPEETIQSFTYASAKPKYRPKSYFKKRRSLEKKLKVMKNKWPREMKIPKNFITFYPSLYLE